MGGGGKKNAYSGCYGKMTEKVLVEDQVVERTIMVKCIL
jgi:hypothetical protein